MELQVQKLFWRANGTTKLLEWTLQLNNSDVLFTILGPNGQPWHDPTASDGADCCQGDDCGCCSQEWETQTIHFMLHLFVYLFLIFNSIYMFNIFYNANDFCFFNIYVYFQHLFLIKIFQSHYHRREHQPRRLPDNGQIRASDGVPRSWLYGGENRVGGMQSQSQLL